MLDIRDLTVEIEGKPVVQDVNLRVRTGELHVLMGPNGSGKSSLLAAIMGLSPYEVTQGSIHFADQPIDTLAPLERARLGIGMAFQRPPSLDGVTIKRLAEALGAENALATAAEALDMTALVDRDMNSGFSGGEIKRAEVLKLMLQNPRLMLFDEPESGVDLEHVRVIGEAIRTLMSKQSADAPTRCGLVITHTGFVLNHVLADQGHIMRSGRLIASGDALRLFSHIQSHGYRAPNEETVDA
ncbi:MAG: ATP-binding cassette domain-containing protein [Pseudomonadota bacterium]